MILPIWKVVVGIVHTYIKRSVNKRVPDYEVYGTLKEVDERISELVNKVTDTDVVSRKKELIEYEA